MSKINFTAAQAFHTELSAELKKVPTFSYSDPETSNAARAKVYDQIKALIETKGGAVRERWDGASINLYGLRASSTSGFEGACRNWISQLTVKAMAAQMGGEA